MPAEYPNPHEVIIEGWKFQNSSLDLSMEEKINFKENTVEYSKNHQKYAQEKSWKKFRLPNTIDECQLPWQKIIVKTKENDAIDIVSKTYSNFVSESYEMMKSIIILMKL